MDSHDATVKRPLDMQMPDDEVIRQVRGGEVEVYEVIMRRYNQRLYRTVRAILGNDNDVEHVMQDAYVSAYTHLRQFESRSSFSTWLTKIAIHEALALKKKQSRFVAMDTADPENGLASMLVSKSPDPEKIMMHTELAALIEQAVESLPESYRLVFVLREVEKLDTRDTAECLGITEENVKVRLHRARGLMRDQLLATAAGAVSETFQFHASRCDRIVDAVMLRIAAI